MKCQSESCVDSCDMKWYECARQVLQLNNISPFVFADAMSDLLAHGRGKFRNIMIVAPANCGKTFLLKPLEATSGHLLTQQTISMSGLVQTKLR